MRAASVSAQRPVAAGQAQPLVLLEQLGFGYPDHAPIVREVSLQLPAGQIHCLLGRSGCGKTTLLKLVAGLLAPTRGAVHLALPEGQAPGRIGFMFQQPNLLEWLTALDNVLLPVSLHRRPQPHERAAAQDLLAQLGLAAQLHRRPRQLSGGQQSRVALARALLPAPPLLLLDEPFSALDAITREDLQADLLRQCRQRGTTLLFVTHDIAEAVYLGDEVSVMADGQLVATHDMAPAAARDTPLFGERCARLRASLSTSAPGPVHGREVAA